MVRVGAERRHTQHLAPMAGERCTDGFLGVGIPQPHCLIGFAGGDTVPVGAERHTGHEAAIGGRGSMPVSSCARPGVPEVSAFGGPVRDIVEWVRRRDDLYVSESVGLRRRRGFRV